MTTSKDNIFRDLGFSKTEAVHLKARSALMFALSGFIQEQGWKQREAAAFFGISQPEVSGLVRGKILMFSLDKLVNLFALTEQQIELRIGGGGVEAEIS